LAQENDDLKKKIKERSDKCSLAARSIIFSVFLLVSSYYMELQNACTIHYKPTAWEVLQSLFPTILLLVSLGFMYLGLKTMLELQYAKE